MFKDREDAGKQLGRALEDYRSEDTLVLAIPRGGVEVGYQAARHLGAEFSLVIARKLPFPDRPEAGFGAVAENGEVVLLEGPAARVPENQQQRIIREQRAEIKRRVNILRDGDPLPPLEGRTVILVDDGIAMGSTMRASIQLCRERRPGTLVAAVPVAGARVKAQIAQLVDDLVVLETPPMFRAVAQVYEHWHDVSDSEVLEIMDRWEKNPTDDQEYGEVE